MYKKDYIERNLRREIQRGTYKERHTDWYIQRELHIYCILVAAD